MATSFLYLTVHRRIAGDVLIYLNLKFALTLTLLFRKRRFRHISLNSASVVTASKKRATAIITNSKSTMRFPTSHRRTLCVTSKSPKGWLKTRIFTYFCVAFNMFVACNRRHFKFGMWVEHSKCQHRTTNCPWNGRGYVTWSTLNFKALNIPSQICYTDRLYLMLKRTTYHLLNGCGYGHVTVLKFCCLPWCSASRGFVCDSWATCFTCKRRIRQYIRLCNKIIILATYSIVHPRTIHAKLLVASTKITNCISTFLCMHVVYIYKCPIYRKDVSWNC